MLLCKVKRFVLAVVIADLVLSPNLVIRSEMRRLEFKAAHFLFVSFVRFVDQDLARFRSTVCKIPPFL